MSKSKLVIRPIKALVPYIPGDVLGLNYRYIQSSDSDSGSEAEMESAWFRDLKETRRNK